MERITTIAPSARLEDQISELLSGELGEEPCSLRADGDGDWVAQWTPAEARPGG